MVTKQDKEKVKQYYDQEASQYGELYKEPLLEQEFYPANAIRLEIIVDRLKTFGVKRLLDIGCGTGQPLLRFLNEGFDAIGFDFSTKMVEGAQKTLKAAGHDPGRVTVADIEVDDTLPKGVFDAIIATGVFPHNLNDRAAYANIRKHLAPGGVLFIEYRNALMALFSINKYSSAFFWNDLLSGDDLSEALRRDTLSFLAEKFNTTVASIGKARNIEYSQILAKFHNPLTLEEELKRHGLKLMDIHYYHFHAAPPHLEKKHKETFWKASLEKERKRDWRNMFLCSALVAEIRHA